MPETWRYAPPRICQNGAGRGLAADANVFDHLVMVAPMHDCLGVAAVVPVVAPVLTIIIVLNALVAIILVVIAPVMVSANDNSAVGIIVR